jgi:hypothetical protein
MTAAQVRPYLPLALAIVIVVAVVLLAFSAGYRAGRASAAHAPAVRAVGRP